MLDHAVPTEYYRRYCIDCDHPRKRHVQLNRDSLGVQLWKCWDCDCRGRILFFK